MRLSTQLRQQRTIRLIGQSYRNFSSNQDTESQIRERLIKASFIHAKYRGFTDDAIAAACRDLELPSVTGAIITNGPYDVVTFAMDQWLTQMKEDLSNHNQVQDGQQISFN